MPKKAPKIYKQGNYEFYYQPFHVIDNLPLDLGVSEDRELTFQITADGFVAADIILCEWEGELYIRDGKRRTLTARSLLAGGNEDFAFLSGKVFLNVHPHDQAAWSIILNEHRSDNPLDYYLMYRELEEAKKWDEVAVQYRLNAQRVKSVIGLNNLRHEEFIVACQNGGITFNNLKDISKLPEARQDLLLEVLKEKQKITVSDIKTARRATQEEVLASSPSFEIPDLEKLAQAEPIEEFFCQANLSTDPYWVGLITTDWDLVQQKVNDDEELKTYRFVEV